MDLSDLFSLLESAKRRGGDMLRNPVDAVAQVMGQIRDSGRSTIADLQQAMPEDDPFGPGAGKDAARARVAESMLNGPLGFAPTGMLRVGGRPDLIATHSTTDLGDLIRESKRRNMGVAELYSPSLAVTKDKVQSNFGNTILVPRVGAFDPKTHTSTLFNRDAYTPRYKDFPGSAVQPHPQGYLDVSDGLKADPLRRDAKYGRGPTSNPGARLDDRFLVDDPQGFKMTEGAGHGNVGLGASELLSPQHADAIQASPAFRSFAAYEKSKAGAGTLRTFTPPGGLSEQYYNEFLNSPTGQKLWDLLDSPAFIQPRKGLMNHLDELDPTDLKAYGEYVRKMRELPSEYGELKVSGPVPITKEHWAGVLLPEGRAKPNEFGELVAEMEYLQRMGIPVTPYAPGLATPTDLFKLADELQRMAGPARKQPL